jgi:hypothetical protein
MKKVDVLIPIYGKPWQTLCTLKSLMSHSGEHIDKIFFIKEPTHPFNDNVDWVTDYFDNLLIYERETSFIYKLKDIHNQNDRLKLFAQYGFEHSDKEFIFIKLDNGRLTIQPTNKVLFIDSSFITPMIPKLKLQEQIYSCE